MIDIKIFTDNVEKRAEEQLATLASQPCFEDTKIRIMPDVHAGMGCVIGFTADLKNKVVPNLVGVDIGCGMLCVELGNLALDLPKLDAVITSCIPSGIDINTVSDSETVNLIKQLKCFKNLRSVDRICRSLGTLGGGNHFIEVDVDDKNNKYLIIHTGSRNLGKQVCEIYQDKAIKNCSYKKELEEEKKHIIAEYKRQHRQVEISEALKAINLKYVGRSKLPEELCYIEGEDRENYLADMKICQQFAKNNRKAIAKAILETYFHKYFYINQYSFEEDAEYFDTIHNYISFDDNIIRKGAISARLGEKVIIPMNMRDGCLIATGKGNADWNWSAPHGAGRVMSRKQAKEHISMKDFQESMRGIYSSTVVENTLDEAPFAYKSKDDIINKISNTVDIITVTTPIYNFKATGDGEINFKEKKLREKIIEKIKLYPDLCRAKQKDTQQ